MFHYNHVMEPVIQLGARGVAAHLAPACRPAQQQSVAIFGQEPANEFAIAKSRGSFLNSAHELPANAVIAKRTPHIDGHLAHIVERDARIVWTERDPSRNPVAHIRDQNRMLWIILSSGDQHPLILHSARLGIKCLHMVVHSFVENSTEWSGVLFTRGTNLQLRSHSCGNHRREFYHLSQSS